MSVGDADAEAVEGAASREAGAHHLLDPGPEALEAEGPGGGLAHDREGIVVGEEPSLVLGDPIMAGYFPTRYRSSGMR